MTLKSITIYSIRGIKELDLEIGSRGAVIYGENGTGKSSIVDAIEYFFSGNISHLKSAKSLSVKDYGTHIHKNRDPEVSLTFLDDTKVTRTFDKKYRVPTPLLGYFKGAQNGKLILRRSQILDFIHDQPSNRYRSFGGLIGLEKLDDIESCFKSLKERAHMDVQNCIKRINYEYDDLSELLNKRIDNKADLLHEVNRMLESENILKIESLDDLQIRKMELMALHFGNDYFNIFSSNPNLAELKNLDLDEIHYLVFTFSTLLTNFYNKSIENYGGLFLQTARELINSINEEKCPICNQGINREVLLEELNARINALEDLEKYKSEIRKTGAEIIGKLQIVITLLSNMFRINLSERNGLDIQKLIDNLTFLNLKITDAMNLRYNVNYEGFDKELENLDTILPGIEKFKKVLDRTQKSKPHDYRELIARLNSINERLYSITKVEEEHTKKLKSYDLTNLIYTKYAKIKKREIQSIYEEIQNDIETFYSIIHPKEDHGKIQLIVDKTKKSNSVDIKVNSFKREVDPRAYQSEGHLDSLGLCVFLAFIKKFNSGCNLLVLDDIVTTIDSNHRNRICELLFEKFPEKQIIITTHDQIWYEQILSTQKMFGIRSKFKNYIIKRWNVNTGLDLIPYRTRIETIQSKLDNLDKQGAGNEIRQYLEFILSEACHNLAVKITFRKNGKYTLNDYFENFGNRISQIKLNSNNSWRDQILKIYTELDAHRSMINSLSHYDDISNSFSIEEINTVFTKANELEKAISCVSCNSMLEYDQTSKFIRCVNHKCKVKTIYQ